MTCVFSIGDIVRPRFNSVRLLVVDIEPDDGALVAAYVDTKTRKPVECRYAISHLTLVERARK